jgi:hypothetical protein
VSAEVGVLEVAYEDTHDTQRLYDTASRTHGHCIQRLVRLAFTFALAAS